jgi:hypothetical protein
MKASSSVDEDCRRGRGEFPSASEKTGRGIEFFFQSYTLKPSISSCSVSFVTQEDAKIVTGNTD